ncbi:MAG: polysaccharide deacetylase family protein, partial [Lactobacillus sp.]|nr:polysaccharide deacetylase family protein [Lactobacillus sp.]
MSRSPEIFLYHRINTLTIDNQLLAVSPEYFEEHLCVIKKSRIILPLYELIKQIEMGKTASDSVAITFDDGYADNFLNALPILERHDAHATFFVNTGLLDQYTACWDFLEDIFLTGRDLPLFLKISCISNQTWPTASPNQRLRAHDNILHYAKQNLNAEETCLLVNQLLEWAGISTEKNTLPSPMMTEEYVRILAHSRFAEVGSHCLTHSRLASMDKNRQRHEITTSCRILERITG